MEYQFSLAAPADEMIVNLDSEPCLGAWPFGSGAMDFEATRRSLSRHRCSEFAVLAWLTPAPEPRRPLHAAERASGRHGRSRLFAAADCDERAQRRWDVRSDCRAPARVRHLSTLSGSRNYDMRVLGRRPQFQSGLVFAEAAQPLRIDLVGTGTNRTKSVSGFLLSRATISDKLTGGVYIYVFGSEEWVKLHL